MLSQDRLINLLNAYLFSQLNYTVVVWGNATKQSLKPLEKAIRRATRVALGKKWNEPIKADVYKVIGCLFPHDNYLLRSSCLIFSILNGNIPYFNNYVKLNSEVCSFYNTRNDKHLFLCKRARTKYGERSILFEPVAFYNSLPAEIVNIQNPKLFQTRVKIYC